jgi:hypothetical protein
MSESNASTQANTSQTSITKDNRIASAENSINLADSSGNNINVTAIDAGAVGKSFDFATAVTEKAADIAAASVGAIQAQSTNALAAVKDAYAGADEQLAQAWADSKAGEQKMIAVAALAAVAMVALKGVR